MAEVFEYAVVRVVPRVDRAEFTNAGVLLYCRSLRFLDARIREGCPPSPGAPELDPEAVAAHLAAVGRVCCGDPATGAPGAQDLAERFRWLASPRSTVVQTSPVHTGLTDDPSATLDRLYAQLVEGR